MVENIKVFDCHGGMPASIREVFFELFEPNNGSYIRYTPGEMINDYDEYDDEYNYLRIQEVDKWFVEQDVTLATDEQEGEEVIVLLWW